MATLTKTEVKQQTQPAPKIGDLADDGAVFVGKTHEGKPVYALPADEAAQLTFQEAQDRAAETSLATGRDYHLPSRGEMYVLFNNRAAAGLGGFQDQTRDRTSWYWTNATTIWKSAYSRRFEDGRSSTVPTCLRQSARLVRN